MAEDPLGSSLDEGDQAPDARLNRYVQLLCRWKAWRGNVPLLYSTCVHFTVPFPSRSVQLYPYVRQESVAPGLLQHAVLYGNQHAYDEPVVVLAMTLVDDPGRRNRLERTTMDRTEAATEVCTFSHPAGDVDRLRYCPARPTLVATKCDGAALSLYDIGPALPLLDVEVAASEGEQGGEGGGAGSSWARERDEDVVEHFLQLKAGHSGGGGTIGLGPVSVLRSQAQEGVSLAWGDSGTAGSSGSGLRLFSGLRCGAVGEYAVREDGSLAEVAVRQGGHDGNATVSDLAWGDPYERNAALGTAEPAGAGPSTAAAAPAAALGMLASAGTDGRTVLWDPRQQAPALYAPRCRGDVNSVAFAPAAAAAGGSDDAAAPLLANAGNDGIVRVYDVRMFGGGGASASTSAAAAAPVPALHRLKGHYCGAVQVAFSPHNRSLLASADVQGRVLLWELGRKAPLEEGLASRPQLLFAHAGHVLEVDDISWSTAVYGTLASTAGYLAPEVVAAAQEMPDAPAGLLGPPPAVQVWRPAADLLPPGPATAHAPAANAPAPARVPH